MRLHELAGIIDVNMRPTYFQKHSIDKPSHILSSTYLGYVHGRTDAITVSLQQVIENFENVYDIVNVSINEGCSKEQRVRLLQ